MTWRTVRRIFTVSNGLVLLWVLTLWWGERTVFWDSVDNCVWQSWEKWPQSATPHHVAFVADPQLVDAHTYPDRPWPLSTLTMKHTDQYLRRSFYLIQKVLVPDSVLFLGDLFDGGREWATRNSTSPEKRYASYGDKYWKKEFRRFVRIFSDGWDEAGSSTNFRGRKKISTLPGNHDLGFGTGIQAPVRARFQGFFGEGNRIDVIGNHTFVSVDTVSLSAMDQPDPRTGSSGAGLGDGEQPNEWIWRNAEDFLENVRDYKTRVEAEELRMLNNRSEGVLFRNEVVDVLEPAILRRSQPEAVGLPTILLTHVPLYRKAATPCGPLREHYPPSSSTNEELDEDEPNAIKIQAGYQYQNVLTQAISNEVVSKVGPNLVQVYSGDDHDYCEISHREFNGSPKEITVKSISWAMGVRRPGFVLTSLWNPIDPLTGKAIETGSGSSTLQNHLCLLPDQLSIFIRYGYLVFFSLAVLFVQSCLLIMSERGSAASPVLPLSEPHSLSNVPIHPAKTPSSSTSSSAKSSPRGLVGRATNATSRYYITSSSKPYYESYPDYGDREHEYGYDSDGAKWRDERRRLAGGGRHRGPVELLFWEFARRVKHVAVVAFGWYFFLVWRW